SDFYNLPVLVVPLTGIGSTTYRYWQYRLPVLAVPLTDIGSTNKRKFFDTTFRDSETSFNTCFSGFWQK
ncbi:MAG: hypothetical protein J6V51_05205, partial [Bacteroidales bacterium]|nr:hypothetical protein [Bacteroidales bacterium]